jgi:hypothetical protein
MWLSWLERVGAEEKAGRQLVDRDEVKLWQPLVPQLRSTHLRTAVIVQIEEKGPSSVARWPRFRPKTSKRAEET